jgi:hypothetical protein
VFIDHRLNRQRVGLLVVVVVPFNDLGCSAAYKQRYNGGNDQCNKQHTKEANHFQYAELDALVVGQAFHHIAFLLHDVKCVENVKHNEFISVNFDTY